MSEITVIGLGLMGTALARAIQRAGHELPVWNRSVAKMQAFIDDGVAGASDVVAAVSASPVILICIDNYKASHAMLRSAEVTPLLAGRTIVQLSTGTPREAREAIEWMHSRDIAYLDGAILAGPDSIGGERARILFSGDKEAYERAEHLVQCLGGTVRYLGANVAAASALDLAWLSIWYGEFMAIAHAATICEAEDVGFDAFVSLFPDRPSVRHHARVIQDESFHDRDATLEVWGAALRHIQRQGADANINTAFPDFVASFFKKAVAAGLSEENVMALVKVLKQERA